MLPFATATQSGLQARSAVSPESADTECMARLCRGDQTALAELYSVHAPRVHAVLRSMVKDPAEADDLLHDVFLQVWRNAHKFSPERGKVLGWLLVIARSRALDRLRSIPRSRTVAWDDATEGPCEAPQEAHHHVGAEQLPEMWAVLSPDERQVLYFGYFEDLTSTEMAQRLGVPVGTIKSRTRSALQKMRSKIGGSK